MLSIFKRLPWLHRILIGLSLALMAFAAFFLPEPHTLAHFDNHYKVGQLYPVEINLRRLAPTITLPSDASLNWQKHQVGNGESAAILFKRLNLSSRLLYQLTSTSPDIERQLSRLMPGDTLEFGFDDDGDLIELRRPRSATETFVVTRAADGFESQLAKKPIITQYNYAQATIHSNFWNAGMSAGLTANQIMALAGIFSWDIDFALDIRKGDHFELLYQEQLVEGEVVSTGQIIAASFRNQGQTFIAILDERSGEYFDQNGRAMKKAFLRAPLDFRRVTSNFNPVRRHPVTGRVVPHNGTDYAAPVGTPIWAAGDGVVEKSDYNKFNGHYVFIRHTRTYMTKYLHLAKRSVKTGQRVKQGQTIGTLGGTGRVTGPHLHYEFLVNGVHKNPRTVDLPLSPSLKGQAKSQFIANATTHLAKLSRYSDLMVAN
ncbi:peptidoglycan DD-metalloendopeptidase family protein [Vibrio sp. WXL103]|uniref:peptidoglycan DD-metalloendopeptidase family protein n=1 Tax=Vibrio sp. WXL103 TaxID=3450710 RepID=UPI003EC52226